MKERIVPEAQVEPDLDARIKEGLCVCFPPDAEVFSKTRCWHGSGPAWSVLIEHDGKVIAHVGIVDRTIRLDGEPVRVAGVQNVFVRPEHRGRRLSAQVLNAAMTHAHELRFDCGLLFCGNQTEKIYSRCGWRTLAVDQILRADESGGETPWALEGLVMFFPLRRKDLHAGRISLQGQEW